MNSHLYKLRFSLYTKFNKSVTFKTSMVYYFRKHINNTTLIRFIVFSLTSFYISWGGYMKRLFSLLLISSLVLTACGSKSHSESNSSEKKSSENKSATDKSESVDSCLEKAKTNLQLNSKIINLHQINLILKLRKQRLLSQINIQIVKILI